MISKTKKCLIAVMVAGIFLFSSGSYLSGTYAYFSDKGEAESSLSMSKKVIKIQGSFNENLWENSDKTGLSVQNLSNRPVWVYFTVNSDNDSNCINVDLRSVIKHINPIEVEANSSSNIEISEIDNSFLNALNSYIWDINFKGTITAHVFNKFDSSAPAKISISGKTLLNKQCPIFNNCDANEYMTKMINENRNQIQTGYPKCTLNSIGANKQFQFNYSAGDLKNYLTRTDLASEKLLSEIVKLQYLEQYKVWSDNIMSTQNMNIDSLKTQLKSAQDTLSEKENAISDLNNKISALNNQINGLSSSISKKDKDNKEKEDKIKQQQDTISKLQKQQESTK